MGGFFAQVHCVFPFLSFLERWSTSALWSMNVPCLGWHLLGEFCINLKSSSTSPESMLSLLGNIFICRCDAYSHIYKINPSGVPPGGAPSSCLGWFGPFERGSFLLTNYFKVSFHGQHSQEERFIFDRPLRSLCAL